jgi:hypothetical protein
MVIRNLPATVLQQVDPITTKRKPAVIDIPPLHRRNALRLLLSLAGAGVTLAVTRKLAAMAAPGLAEIEGDVRVNGARGQPRQIVAPGDRVTTGPGGGATLVFGNDAFLLRERTDVIFPVEGNTAERVLTVVSGKLMGVFGKQTLRIETPVATIGIRGTGAYTEVYPDRTYFCLCYGKAEVRSRADPAYVENLDTFHHDAPRNLYADPARRGGVSMEAADMVNHMDEELILLESLVGRIPLFGPNPIEMPAKEK